MRTEVANARALGTLEDEPGRLAAVARYEILDTPPDGAFDRITALAAKLFGTPIAIVSIVDEDRIWFKSHHGIDAQEVDRDPGLCASAILHEDTWIVENAGVDPRTLTNPLVAGELGLRFYAGAPLRTHDGYNLGTLCVLDREPRQFLPEQALILKDLADVVVHELEVRIEARRAIADLRDQEESQARLRRDAQKAASSARGQAAKLKAVIGAIPDAFFLVTPRGHVALANSSGRTLLSGANRLTEVLSNLLDEGGASPSVADILRQGSVELSQRATGRTFEARAYAAPMADTGPRVGSGATILILRDVTDERRLRAIQEALVGMLSHELRTPVSSIYAAAVLLARDQDIRTDDERRELIVDVAAEAERLRRLIEDLLVLTEAERGEIQVATEPIHLARLLESLVARERTRWPDRRIELRVDPHLRAVSGEDTYVEQIVDNLVSNAVKYSDQGTTIAIDALQVESWVDIHVRDFGPGIEASDRERLFELLFRSPATAGKVQGAGIGLFVCRTLARAMGGDIRIEDPRGPGSDFVVRLPMYQDL